MSRPINPTKATLDAEIGMLKMDIFPLIEMTEEQRESWIEYVQLRHALERVASCWDEGHLVSGCLGDQDAIETINVVFNVLNTGECYPDE